MKNMKTNNMSGMRPRPRVIPRGRMPVSNIERQAKRRSNMRRGMM